MFGGEDVPSVVLDVPLRAVDAPADGQRVVRGIPGGIEFGHARVATISISIFAAIGSAATPMVVRAGGVAPTRRP